jgi:hypothetical protein
MDGLGRLKYAKDLDAYSPSVVGNCPIYVNRDEKRTDVDNSRDSIIIVYTGNSI